MAIAQRQYPRIYSHAVARPLPASRPARRPRTRTTGQHAALGRWLTTAALAVGACVFYLCGYVLMTGANFDKVRLTRQFQELQAQNQLFNSELLQRRDKDAVEKWALANGMQRLSSAQFIVTRHTSSDGR